MGLRNWLRKLERGSSSGAGDDLVSFPLQNGERYYHAPGPEIFLHCYDCIGKNPHDWPPSPEALTKIAEARDPVGAFESIMGGSPTTDDFAYFDIFPYSPEILVNERRLEPRSLVAGRDPFDREIDDLSE
jgi:hypothetical protein